MDNVDGDVSALILAAGVGSITTGSPTPTGQLYSFVVTYSVADLSGNKAM